jgi:glycosyltransferase involved in cell wall biosynthesis
MIDSLSNKPSLNNFKKGEKHARNLVVSFCNQIASPNHSLCLIDTFSGNSSWLDFTAIPDELRQNFSGVSGVCNHEDKVIFVTQGALPILGCISGADGQLNAHIILQQCKDAHSVVFKDDYVYVVSTGTNQIYRIPFIKDCFGSEELYWSYPGVKYDSDEVHLNGLTLDGDHLIASCFGPRQADGSWDSRGRVFYLTLNKKICEGLNQPHSPTISDKQLIFAESAKHQLYILEKKENEWAKNQIIKLKGYTRGITVLEDSIFVAISANRKVSRSTKNEISVNYGKRTEACLIEVNLKTGKVLSEISLLGYGKEPYDLVVLNNSFNTHSAKDSICERIYELELMVDRYALDINRLHKENNTYIQNNTDLVTIIIPTFNRAEFIGDAIKSVLTQTYSNIELIVIDDGSTDQTEDIILTFSDDRLTYIKQRNKGRSNARNHALSLASGRYITFLDSDDLYLPNKIESQVAYLKNHPGVGMVYTSAHCIDTHGKMLEHKYLASTSGLIYESIAFFTPVTITLPTVMTYKSVLDQVGNFDEKMDRFEDTDMWRRISKCYRIDAMPEFTCLLRTHQDNSLLNQSPNKIRSALDYYANKIKTEDIEFDLRLRNKGLYGLYTYYANALLSVPHFAEEGKLLMKTAKQHRSLNVELLKSSLSQQPLIRSVYYKYKAFDFSNTMNVGQKSVHYKTKFKSLIFWSKWIFRFVYFRSANFGYKLLVKTRRFFKSY